MLLLLKNDGSTMPYTRIRLFPPFSWHAWRPVAIFAANQKSWLVADGGASPAKTPLLACRSAVNSSRRNKCRRPSHRPAILDPRGRRSHGGEARGERRPSEQGRRDSCETRGAALPTSGGARAGAMASVEQYLTVLAGAQSAQNAEAQRAAAQMQIEVRLPCDHAHHDAQPRSIRSAANAPHDRRPPRRSSIPSFFTTDAASRRASCQPRQSLVFLAATPKPASARPREHLFF